MKQTTSIDPTIKERSVAQGAIRQLADIRRSIEVASNAYTAGADHMRLAMALGAARKALQGVHRTLLLARMKWLLQQKRMSKIQRAELIRLFRLLIQA